ncbi:MAG: M1 family metallopeptidase [Gemmatimonadetes bacterium]|nr:M1 family metallopeptidase [Gemmatimonadota bacterium]
MTATRLPRASHCALALTAFLLTLLPAARPSAAQNTPIARPIPARVAPPPEYQRAIERGWRSENGAPGHSYWQQGASYDIDARLDPPTAKLEGTVRIAYANNAPATLRTVFVLLHQNFHRADAVRHDPGEITGGITLRRVTAAGAVLEEDELEEGPAYHVDGTVMELRPPSPLEQGDTLQLELEWEMTVPQKGINERMGHSNHEVYFVAYWFPKMAVLDDLRVWDAEPFLGTGEFYDDFANYTVALTVPVDWSVHATGTLQNSEEVYSALTIQRLAAAGVSDTLVMIAGRGERDALAVTADAPEGSLTYRFAAENVRDFTWTASNVQRWDASSAVVPSRTVDGGTDRVLIHALWRPDRAPLWSQAWLYGKQSIEYFSTYTGFSYPWPHMTVVEGTDIIGGGMEFPMLTLLESFGERDAQGLFNTTAHEIGHMWLPMIVGSNEKRYAWMDEGAANFLENQAKMELYPGIDHHRVDARTFLGYAAARQEEILMRHGDWYESSTGYGIASYYKPAALMAALRFVLGAETWDLAYRTYIAEWAYKHPTPWDFFSTFERVAGRDLDWFWTSFYYETWTLDHSVGDVTTSVSGQTTVTIEDRGQAPFPAQVRIRTASGQTLERDVPVEHWLAGNTTYVIDVGRERVTRVEIDPAGYAPDVDRANNLWPRG